MHLPRITGLLTLSAIAFTFAAFLLPLSAIELAGVPLIVAGAYLDGLRGGVISAVWSILVTTSAYLLTAGAQSGDFTVSVVAYALVGVGLGLGVDRFKAQHRRLEDAVEHLEGAHHRLEESQRRYRLLFESSNDAVYLHGLDAHGEPTRFAAVNDATCARLGYSRDEMLGLTPRAIDAAPAPGQMRRMMETLQREGSVVYESARKTREGHVFPVEISSSLSDVGGEPLVLSISRDITDRVRARQELERLSLVDELTGLYNRRGFSVMLAERRKHARRTNAPVVVLYADLDGLKLINDTHGHARGDRALVGVADALRAGVS